MQGVHDELRHEHQILQANHQALQADHQALQENHQALEAEVKRYTGTLTGIKVLLGVEET